MNISIVIPCYNRTQSLQRLLLSLQEAYYQNDKVDLIFSIDNSGTNNVQKVAEDFSWKFGEKKFILHHTNIGLKNNILACGDLVEIYDAVIVLEDDLYVGKDFYHFAKQAALYYMEDSNIAGISLFSYRYAEIGYFQFYPFRDGKDTFFIQWPSSWGQLWTREQWKSFRAWLGQNKDITQINIPVEVKEWTHSWKKFFIAYMVDMNKFFVYPYVSFTNEFGTAGIHYEGQGNVNTVDLFMGVNVKYRFRDFEEESLFKYDCFYQMIDKIIQVDSIKYNVCFDLYSTKELQNLTADYVVTARKQSNAIHTFGHTHIPFEYNILRADIGDFFYLVKRENFVESEFDIDKKIALRMNLSTKDMIKKIGTKIKKKFMRYL